MKKTLLFSNVIGNILNDDSNSLRFNDYMEKYLINNIDNTYNLVFINAPGLGNEDKYLEGILKCFNKIGITFNDIIDVEKEPNNYKVEEYIKNNNKIIYFLMGGNPYTQMEIINIFKLRDVIKNHDGLVIGFCAGAINLSKKSIITTDEDFNKSYIYEGLNRIDLVIEPHYNKKNDKKRNDELKNFVDKYKIKIHALPDESIIVIEDEKVTEYGKIYYFE